MHFKDHQHHAKRWLFPQKKRLVKALLGCQVMADRERRKSVLRELRVEIRTNITYDGTESTHLLNIVSTCVEHEDGLQELVEIVHFFEKRSIGYVNLEETIEDILTPGMIRKQQRDELVKILSGVTMSSEVLLKLYRESLPFGMRIDSQAKTLRSILWHLAKLPQQKGGVFPYPILEFALRLAFAIDHQQIREQIEAWVEARANELQLPTSEMTSLRERLTPRPKRSDSEKKLYLLIELEPDGVGKHREVTDDMRYIVRAWLLGDDIEREITPERECYTLEQMPSLIEDELLEEVYRDSANEDKKLRIELLLPNELICHDVENWALDDEEPIGYQYPVVVRLQARFKRRKYKAHWSQCWQKVDLLQVVSTHSVVWCHTITNETWRTVRTSLKPAHRVCLALTSIPPRDDDSRRDLLSILVRSGTPIAIWPRLQRAENVEEVRKKLEALLTHGALEKLPDLVHQKRMKAWEKNQHRHFSRENVTLLWDDPTRIPPPARQLSAPVRER